MSETRDPGNIADNIEVEGNLTVVSVEDADKDGTPEKVEMQDDAGNKIVATFEENGDISYTRNGEPAGTLSANGEYSSADNSSTEAPSEDSSTEAPTEDSSTEDSSTEPTEPTEASASTSEQDAKPSISPDEPYDEKSAPDAQASPADAQSENSSPPDPASAGPGRGRGAARHRPPPRGRDAEPRPARQLGRPLRHPAPRKWRAHPHRGPPRGLGP